LQKDQRYDLEQNVNLGDEGDLWVPDDILGPGTVTDEDGETITVYPNTDAYQNGTIVPTGISIKIVSRSDTKMYFQVEGLGGNPNQMISTAIPKPQVTTAPTTQTTTAAATAAPTPLFSMSTSSTYNASKWVLSRPPIPTKAPVVLPEYPQTDTSWWDELNKQSTSSSPQSWRRLSISLNGMMGLALIASFIGRLF
jgi:hypothetical protein